MYPAGILQVVARRTFCCLSIGFGYAGLLNPGGLLVDDRQYGIVREPIAEQASRRTLNETTRLVRVMLKYSSSLINRVL